MLEACQSHLGFGNLNVPLRPDLFTLLPKRTPLLWHYRLSTLHFGQSLLANLHIRFDNGYLWHPHSFSLDNTCLECIIVYLLV